MKKYSCFQAMYMSFYSRDLYQDVAKNWGASVVLYLFILLAISWAVLVVKVQPAINTAFIGFANKIAPQIPPMTLDKGKLVTPEKRPYEIADPGKKVFAIIDTSGKYTSLCLTDECQQSNLDKNIAPVTTRILVTEDKIMYADTADTIKIQSLPKNLTMDIKPDVIQEKVIKFVGWSWVIFFPVLLIFSFAYRLIQSLLYAVIGKVFASLGNNVLTYTEVLKITIITLTPAIVLDTIFDWFNVSFHFEWLLYFIITMIYLIFALNANRATQQGNVVTKE